MEIYKVSIGGSTSIVVHTYLVYAKSMAEASTKVRKAMKGIFESYVHIVTIEELKGDIIIDE